MSRNFSRGSNKNARQGFDIDENFVGQGVYYSHERSKINNNTELALSGRRVREASQTSASVFGLLTGRTSDGWYYLGLDLLLFLFLLADVRAMVMPQRSSSCFSPIRLHMPA
jgi:hypothetical protein